MPTYRACGVTARLNTCELKPTLSNFVDLRMGGEQRKDATRIQKALCKGEPLAERVIGPDGSEKGVVQFIGAHEDMPLCVVECSSNLNATADAVQTESNVAPFSSPLTSLGGTPVAAYEAFEEASRASWSVQPHRQAGSKARTDEYNTLESALQDATTPHAPAERALVLEIAVGNETFLPAPGGSASLAKDLKIEVFINGELADVNFINARRSAAQLIGDKIRVSGTRVHRQTEKPWVYKDGIEGVGGPVQTSEQRWRSTSDALLAQARQRGTDKYGDLQPSAAFLGALASVHLPGRLRSAASIGIIDFVITAGKGQKYGPETAYLTQPTSMDDPLFSRDNPAVDPMLLAPLEPTASIFDGGAVASPLRALDLSWGPLTSSPEVPLRRARKASASASPSPSKKAVNLAREYGFDLTIEESKQLTLGAFENKRGGSGPAGRSLLQRLGDLKKMNERNRNMELAKLREALSEFVATDASAALPEEERPLKRARTNSDVNYIDPSKTIMNGHTMGVNQAMAEDDVFGAIDPSLVNPDAVLAQDRIDMALDSGAASNGALLRRIASKSPGKTPRKTRASALAYSPTRTVIKEQSRPRAQNATPQKPSDFSSTLGVAPPFALPSQTPSRPTNPSPPKSNGANRTSQKWNPEEKSFADTLEQLEAPANWKGSCVGFASEKQSSRQIGKARGGIFKEEGVVVGMRFCVW